MSLTSKLKQARHDMDLTQEQVAELAGLERNTIWRYEAGLREPSASTLNVLARIFRKPVDWFWKEESDNDEDPNRSIQADRELVMNEASLALRSAGHELSDEAIRSIADFIRYVYDKEARERREREEAG